MADTALQARLPKRLRLVAILSALVLVAMPTVLGRAGDIVIMKDGFTLEGRWFKESELIMDVPGRPVRISKANGFDVVENGPKFTIFSTHAKRGGKVEQGLDIDRGQALTRDFPGSRSRPLPGDILQAEMTPFDKEWNRTIRLTLPLNNFEIVKQRITYMDPNTIGLQSLTHAWRQAYHTIEWEPAKVTALLRDHPDLKDIDGKVDPMHRFKIAEFLKTVGWPGFAREELQRLVKDFPTPWEKDVQDRFDNITKLIDQTESSMFAKEMAIAVEAGRYDFARILNGGFKPRSITEEDSLRLTKARAQLNTLSASYDETVHRLRQLIETASGMGVFTANCAVAGTAAGLYFPRPELKKTDQKLLNAASTILKELHPDTVERISHFSRVAGQEEKRRKDGLPATTTSDQLLSLAITGWLNGKNGWNENVNAALRNWDARQMILDYLHGDTQNNRYQIFTNFQSQAAAEVPIGPDVLAQMVSYLPPPFAEDLANPKGTLVPKEKFNIEGIREQTTSPSPRFPKGHRYVLHLPPEYHHGRSYPVILALGDVTMPAEQMVALLAPQADRFGYIVAAPVWANQFSTSLYDFSGEFFPNVLSTLHDLRRRFQVDSDRVFLWGHREGANFALDVGMAHPDLFAGIVANGANPPTFLFINYWKNAQKLPIYIINGEISGAFTNLRRVYEKWTTAGFPALLTVYKGRGIEWFGVEQPTIFDWLGRKKRARGTASLRLTKGGFDPWQILRDDGNHRFYWVSVPEDGLTRPGWEPGKNAPSPAQFRADIRNGVIAIDQAIGVNKFTIWLERDLIDWDKPIRITVNSRRPINYRAEILKPDPIVMLEELYRTGDRKMLYLGKIDIQGPG